MMSFPCNSKQLLAFQALSFKISPSPFLFLFSSQCSALLYCGGLFWACVLDSPLSSPLVFDSSEGVLGRSVLCGSSGDAEVGMLGDTGDTSGPRAVGCWVGGGAIWGG